jgi:hypothetical protein
MSFCLLLYCLLVLFLFSFLGEWEKSKRVISWFIYNSYKFLICWEIFIFIFIFIFYTEKKTPYFLQPKKNRQKNCNKGNACICAWRSFLALEFLYLRYPGELVGRYQVPLWDTRRPTETGARGCLWVARKGQPRSILGWPILQELGMGDSDGRMGRP